MIYVCQLILKDFVVKLGSFTKKNNDSFFIYNYLIIYTIEHETVASR